MEVGEMIVLMILGLIGGTVLTLGLAVFSILLGAAHWETE